MAKKEKKKNKIANPQEQLDRIKSDRYKIGGRGVSFHDIKEMKPVFAFDYLSLGSSGLCYNCSSLKKEDYLGFLEALKTNSKLTYNELRITPNFRFHPVRFDDNVSIKPKDLKKVLSSKPDEIQDDDLPTLYQFDLHYNQKARAVGFLYKGIFYLVWFDRNHSIYSHKK